MGYATVVSSAFDSSACALGCNSRVHTYRQTRTHSHIYLVSVYVLFFCPFFHSVIHFVRVLRSLFSPSTSPAPSRSVLTPSAMSMLHFLPLPSASLDSDVSEEETFDGISSSYSARVRRNRRAKVKTLLVTRPFPGFRRFIGGIIYKPARKR